MTLVSVIIPSFNHAAFIKEAVDSVLQQSASDLELIVVDDGSTDQSIEILSGVSDQRLQVIRQDNRGAHAAINRGLNRATGKFLSILNSDDSYHPERLEKTIAVLVNNKNIGLVGTYIQIIDANNRTLGIKHGYQDCEPWLLDVPQKSFRAQTDLRAALLTENYWATTSNFVFPRQWYEKVGEFRPLRFTHDWDFALRMARIAELKMLPEPLLKYRVHEANTIHADQVTMIYEICWCLAMHLPSYLSDERFFEELPVEIRNEQLLHSIYVFGLERLLSVMLLQRLAENPTLALQLLDPDNPIRLKHLDFIKEKLAAESQNETANAINANHFFTSLHQQTQKIHTWLRRILK
jgi:glycosyltransferase involved in cell wall biosynthesis